MKTANTILYENGIDTMRLDDNFNSNLFQAMEEYLQQSYASQPSPVMSAEQVGGAVTRNLLSTYTSPSVNADGWVSVEEGLPLTGKRVLCITTSGFISVGYNYRDVWEMNDCGESFASRGYTVTHWHPIPAPPNVNNNNHQ